MNAQYNTTMSFVLDGLVTAWTFRALMHLMKSPCSRKKNLTCDYQDSSRKGRGAKEFDVPDVSRIDLGSFHGQ